MDAEQQGSSGGFPLVSDKPKHSTSSALLVGDEVIVRTEDLYRPTSDKGFDHEDERVGFVSFMNRGGEKGPFAALLTLLDGSTAAVTGPTPGADGADLWVGKTTVHVGEATGSFEPWRDQDIPLESENPKRWG
jgi:hypothetical protein